MEHWLIRKRGYFYRPDRKGYASSVHEAGRYTQEEAEAEARIKDSITAYPLSEFFPRGRVLEHPPVMSRWRHLKTGGCYKIVGKCVIESTMEQAVMYEPEDEPDPTVWVRLLDEFLDGRFKRTGR